MSPFGFKVVDRDAAELAPVLAYARTHACPVEVGLYFDDPAARRLLEAELPDLPAPVNAHTRHNSCNAFNLNRTLPDLAAHIRHAKRIGSRYSVLHAAALPLPQRPAARARVIDELLQNLSRADALCQETDYRLHLENVFHPLDFYRALFDGIRARGLQRIHFCFDIGHAKVWSQQSLAEWLDFITELQEAGFALHCHLHANHGLADQHLSLQEAVAAHIDAPDGDYNAYGYPGAYWALQQRFPQAVKVFEVKAPLAIANLEAVLAAEPAR